MPPKRARESETLAARLERLFADPSAAVLRARALLDGAPRRPELLELAAVAELSDAARAHALASLPRLVQVAKAGGNMHAFVRALVARWLQRCPLAPAQAAMLRIAAQALRNQRRPAAGEGESDPPPLPDADVPGIDVVRRLLMRGSGGPAAPAASAASAGAGGAKTHLGAGRISCPAAPAGEGEAEGGADRAARAAQLASAAEAPGDGLFAELRACLRVLGALLEAIIAAPEGLGARGDEGLRVGVAGNFDNADIDDDLSGTGIMQGNEDEGADEWEDVESGGGGGGGGGGRSGDGESRGGNSGSANKDGNSSSIAAHSFAGLEGAASGALVIDLNEGGRADERAGVVDEDAIAALQTELNFLGRHLLPRLTLLRAALAQVRIEEAPLALPSSSFSSLLPSSSSSSSAASSLLSTQSAMFERCRAAAAGFEAGARALLGRALLLGLRPEPQRRERAALPDARSEGAAHIDESQAPKPIRDVIAAALSALQGGSKKKRPRKELENEARARRVRAIVASAGDA